MLLRIAMPLVMYLPAAPRRLAYAVEKTNRRINIVYVYRKLDTALWINYNNPVVIAECSQSSIMMLKNVASPVYPKLLRTIAGRAWCPV